MKSFFGAIQYPAKFLPKLSEKTDRLRNLLKKNDSWIWGEEQEKDFKQIKPMLTDKPSLAHYAKDKCNMVTTDASKTGLGITLWQKQHNGEIKPIASGSRYLKDTEKNFSIGELELLAVVWGLEKFRFYLYGKKVPLYADHQALEPLIKRKRSNHHYSARLTRWLDRLAHFDIALQHIAGRNLKITDYLSRNPVEGAPTKSKYSEEYVINKLIEPVKLNTKYGSLFDSQSECSKQDTETKQNPSENKNEQRIDESHQNRTFQNKCHVNKTNNSENTSSGQSEISTAKTSSNTKSEENIDDEKMNRENLYHWGATREIMEIIRRRKKPQNTTSSRKKRSLSESRNYAETVRHTIAKNDIHIVRTEQKKPRRNCGD